MPTPDRIAVPPPGENPIIHEVTTPLSSVLYERLSIEEEGASAYIEFLDDGQCITILHTFVSEKLRGLGLGRWLVFEVAGIASKRANSLAAECAYASRILMQESP